MCQEIPMSPLEEALKLAGSVSEEEGDMLADKIMQSECASNQDQVHDVANALWNIGQHRYSGVGFSKPISDTISSWLEEYFDENAPCVDRMIDVVYELTSEQSDEMVRRLIQKTKAENIKGCLLEAFAYKGT